MDIRLYQTLLELQAMKSFRPDQNASTSLLTPKQNFSTLLQSELQQFTGLLGGTSTNHLNYAERLHCSNETVVPKG